MRGRSEPSHPWPKVFDCVFLGAAIPTPKVHRWEAECPRGILRQRLGRLSEDTLGYARQREDPASIFALGCEGARRLKRNGVLHSDGARGRWVAAIDGLEIGRSFFRCGDAWREREVEHQVDDVMRKDVQYYHRPSADGWPWCG